MILELVILNIRQGEESAFEEAFAHAKSIIAEATGFISLSLGRCVETDARYSLLIQWETLEDHVEGFRQSERYQRWKALLHHFYDPMPTVEHYIPIVGLP